MADPVLQYDPPPAPVVRRRGPRPPALAALGLGLLAFAAVAWLSLRPSPGGADRAATKPTATAAVARRDLVETETIDGTLGYAGRRSVVNRLAGTITWLPPEGATVRRGRRLFDVDGRPVVLMYGSMPAYRRLAEDVPDGDDVEQLERNLAALGHWPGPVDGRFDAATAAAVRAWQRSLDLRATGAVELGRVVFLPGPRRIADVKAALGSGGSAGGQAGGGADAGAGTAVEVMTTTSRRRIVTVRLDADKQRIAVRGKRAEVELPDGGTLRGRIASVGTVATSSGSGGGGEGAGGGGEDDGTARVTVTISLPARARRTRLDQAPVTVHLARQSRRDVLAVPVTALLATGGGGYAVQVLDAAGRARLVRVTPGLFADGYVEVAGGGLRAGMRVSVPR